MGILFRLIAVTGCLLAGLLTANSAFAVDYYWTDGVSSASSPGAFCNAAGARTFSGDPYFVSASVTYTGGTYTTCSYMVAYAENGTPIGPVNGAMARLGGSTCPLGTGPFDDATGICTPPAQPVLQPGEKCDDQTGGTPSNPMIYDATVSHCVKFTESEGDAPCQFLKSAGDGNPNYKGTSYTVTGNISATGQATAPPTFADGGVKCQVSTISSSECTLNVSGVASCNVIGKFNGSSNPSGTTDAADAMCEGGTCPPKQPKTETKEEGCVPVGTGGGGTTCTQKKETAAEGSQQCGSVNGAYTCITKKPSSNGITTTINASSQTLPDGSVKVTTVKDSSNTVCTDVNSCTTQTSSTTTHSTSSPSGGTKNETTCTGACTPTGGGLETNPAAGTGTGTGTGSGGDGTCTGDNCGEGGDGTASTSDTCAAPPACDGDPFLCAILKQDHIDTCKLMAAPTSAEMADLDAKIASERAKVDANQSAMDSQVNTLLSGFQGSTGGSGTGGGKCLPDVPFSVMGHGMQIEFSKACDSISFIRLAILAMAYLFAARIVFREV